MPINNLQIIPGIGPKTAKELADIGIAHVEDLKGKDPEILYAQICAKNGMKVDRCVLYVCRSSVYFAEHSHHDPEKLIRDAMKIINFCDFQTSRLCWPSAEN